MKRAYSLSFVPPQKAPSRCPQLVIATTKEIARSAEEVLEKYLETSLAEWVSAYTGAQPTFASFFDLFGPAKFGYGGCGSREESEDEVRYVIDLRGPQMAPAVALTLEHLFSALNIIGGEGFLDDGAASSNQQQFFQVDIGFRKKGEGLNSHSLGGTFAAPVGKWFALAAMAKPQEEPNAFSEEAYIGHPFPDESVREAMRATWQAIVPDFLQEFDENCRVGLKPSGHFALVCFGSNVAPFPDLTPEMDTGYPGRFTDWNMDNVYQQLTMLAGLAALHDVIAKDLG